MRAIEDAVHALGLVAGGDTGGIVVAVPDALVHKDTVRTLAIQSNRRAIRGRELVDVARLRALGTTAGAFFARQVVGIGRLVVDDGDDAGCIGAEGVLDVDIGYAAGRGRRDVCSGVVGATLDLVEWTGVRLVHGACGAVCGDARSATISVDVTGCRRYEGRRCDYAREQGRAGRRHLDAGKGL